MTTLTDGAARALALIAARNELHVNLTKVESQLDGVPDSDRELANQVLFDTLVESTGLEPELLAKHRPGPPTLWGPRGVGFAVSPESPGTSGLLAEVRALPDDERHEFLEALLADFGRGLEAELEAMIPDGWKSPLNRAAAQVAYEVAHLRPPFSARAVGHVDGFPTPITGPLAVGTWPPGADSPAAFVGVRRSLEEQLGLGPLDGALGAGHDVDAVLDETEELGERYKTALFKVRFSDEEWPYVEHLVGIRDDGGHIAACMAKRSDSQLTLSWEVALRPDEWRNVIAGLGSETPGGRNEALRLRILEAIAPVGQTEAGTAPLPVPLAPHWPPPYVLEQMRPDELGALVYGANGRWVYAGDAANWLRVNGPSGVAHLCYPPTRLRTVDPSKPARPPSTEEMVELCKGRRVQVGKLRARDGYVWGVWLRPLDVAEVLAGVDRTAHTDVERPGDYRGVKAGAGDPPPGPPDPPPPPKNKPVG